MNKLFKHIYKKYCEAQLQYYETNHAFLSNFFVGESMGTIKRERNQKKIDYYKAKRERPYNGEAHTDYGKRGKTLVEGLTMRDICDCYVRGLLLASSHLVPELYAEACKGEDAKLDRNNIYGFNLDEVDPGAVQQNMMCEIERMMGIFPNIPINYEEREVVK